LLNELFGGTFYDLTVWFDCSNNRNPDDSDARQKAKALAETQARKCAQKICTAVFDSAKELMETTSTDGISYLSRCSLVSNLLPSILAHLPHLAKSDPRVRKKLVTIAG